MKSRRIIADEETALRLGHERAAARKFTGRIRIISYPQSYTNLTLFAAELVTPNGKVIETIVTQ